MTEDSGARGSTVHDPDVIVVGAGPSGLTVATELALRGCAVTVLERRPEPETSRAGALLPRTLQLFDYRGHVERFISRGREIRENALLQHHIWAGMRPVLWRCTDQPFPHRLTLQQHVTEQVLGEVAAGLGVRVLREHEVVDLTQDEERVVLQVRAGSTAPPSTMSARYVVGADGGRSAVRRLAGIGFEGHDGTFTGMIADVAINMDWKDGRATADNQHGWAASFPFGPGGSVTRFNMVHAERRHADKSEPITAAEMRTCLEQIFERDFDFDELLWSSRFTDAMRLASAFRSGRVLLVGESTRIHYPASGVGMNFCIQDAFNLGWKLAHVVAGDADPGILDSYEAERRPVTEALLESVRAQVAIQFDFSAEGVAFRRMFSRDLMPLPQVQRALGLQLLGLTDPYPAAPGAHATVGTVAPDLHLHTATGLVRVAELLHQGRLVLADLTGEGLFAELATDPRIVTATGVLSSVPPGWQGVTAVLLRPDGYLAWTSTDERPSSVEARRNVESWLLPHRRSRGRAGRAATRL